MKIIVIGGTGLIGSKLIANFTAQGHDAVAAAPSTGVDTITGAGLAQAAAGADIFVDVTNAPSWEDQAVLDFFTTSTTNQLAAEREAGVKRHVALSIVGADLEPDSGYLRAKVAQEKVIQQSGMPYTIVRSTQFHEFVRGIAEAGAQGDTIHLTGALFQPIAADDVARLLSQIATDPTADGVVEIGGPEAISLVELGRRALAHDHDARKVIADADARYFGTKVQERSLVPGAGARLGAIRFDDWLQQSSAQVRPPQAKTA